MTDRDKHIAKKRKEIEKITKQQVRLILKSSKIISAPYKRTSTLMKRMLKLFEISAQVRVLEMQKQIIISKPIPKVTGFLLGGPAIVGECGPEFIVTSNGKIEIK